MLKWLADITISGVIISTLFAPAASLDEEIESEAPMAQISVEAYTVGTDYILSPTGFEIVPDETCASFVLRALESEGIECGYAGSAEDGFYLQSIGDLAEFSNGPKSGWLYLVNGEFPSSGMSDTLISDGDAVRVIYSVSWGDDLEK